LHEHANYETQNQREATQKVFDIVRDSPDKVKFLIKNGLILEIGCLAQRGNGSLLDIEITLVNAFSKKENEIQVKKAYNISLHQRFRFARFSQSERPKVSRSGFLFTKGDK
jgi:hypothetical protein